MAEEVGVLNLTIHDNSEQAGQGLQSLADALSRVKRVVKNIDLSPVGQQVVALAKTIKEARGTSTIVKNLGTMFNAINKFSSIKKFTIDTEQIRDTAQNLLKLAEAKEKVDEAAKTSVATGDWRSGMSTIADDTKKAVAEVDKSIDGFKETMDRAKEIAGNTGDLWSAFMRMGAFSTARPGGKQVAGQISMDLDNLLKETKSEIQSKTGDFQEIGERAGRQIATGLTLTKEDIANSSGLIGDFMKQSLYTSLKTEDIMDKPLEYLHDIFRTTTASMKDYESGVGAVLPKVQELSSEEMLLAGNAKRAAEAMEVSNKLFSNLEKPIDYSNLTKYTEVITGVTDRVKKLAQDSAGIFAVPALDQSGPFKYAAEEVQHYTDLLNKARSDMEFWDQKYSETMKQIKYNGATEERTNMLGHAEEGFSQAVARMEEYDAVLVRINEHIANYQENSKGIGSIQGIYENSIAGPLLAGLQGAEAQAMMIQAVSRETGLSIEEIKRQITELSNGAVQFEDAANKVNEATETAADGGVNELNRQLRETASAADPAISKIELLRNKVNHYWSRISKLSLQPAVDAAGKDTGRDNAINEYLLKILKVNDEINKLIENAHKAQDALQFDALVANADNRQRDYGMETVDNMVNQYSEIDLLTMKMDGLKQALADDINQNKVDTQQIAERVMAIQNLKEKIDELVESEEKAARSSTILGDAFSSLKSGIQKMFPTITGLLKRFKNMMVMRAMRYVIRQIGAGLSEGLENVYWYSKAVGTEFAPAMDSAASALAQMKNSIGAALAPVLQALIPVLQTIVNWFINLINYANQFFALLNGQSSWTKALETPISAFEDKTKKAKKAAKEAKDLLADWDELNIIQSKSGGTGTGDTTPGTDYTKMFTQVKKFNKTIQDIVDGIKKKFGSIWELIKQIGIGILEWKASKLFTGLVSDLLGLAALGTTIKLLFDVTTIIDENYLKTGENGWLVANLLTTLIGGVLTSKILSNVLGGEFAKLAIPLTLSVSAVADLSTVIGATDTSAISKEALVLSAVGSLKAGAAAGYLAYMFGNSLLTSILGGAAFTLLTFGVALGIKAVARAEKGQVTEETIKTTALSSLSIGIGAGLLAKLLGASFLLSAGIGAGAAVFTVATIAAAIGIKAYLVSKKQDIKWGNFIATQEQVKTFVREEMFEADFFAKLTLIDANVTASDEAKNTIREQVEAIEIPLNKLKLKVDTDNAVEEIKKQVFGDSDTGETGLIGKFKDYAANQVVTTETTFKFVPIKGEDGSDESGEFMAKSIEGWDILTKEMDRMGEELNKHLVKSMETGLSDDLKQYELNAATQIVETMNRVTLAATTGMASGKAEIMFELGLKDMSMENVGEAVELYDQYIKDAEEEYTKATTATAASYKSQALAFLELSYAATDPEVKKYYEDKAAEFNELYEKYKNKVLHGIEEATKGDRAKGKELFTKWLKSVMDIKPEDFKNSIDMANGGGAQWVKQMFSTLGATIRNNEGKYSEQVSTDLNNVFDAILKSVLLPEEYEVINNAVKAGLFTYTDIFSEDYLNEMIKYLGDDSYYGEAIRKAWNKMLGKTVEETDAAEKATDNLTENTSDNVTKLKNLMAELGAAEVKEYDVLKIDNSQLKKDANETVDVIEEMRESLAGIFDNMPMFEMPTFDNQLLELEEKFKTQAKVPPTALGYRAAAGASLAGYSSNPSYSENSEENNEQEISNMAQGVQRGNTDVVSALLQLIDVANAINRKDFTVNLNASAGLGALMNRSLSSLGKVTGD